MLDATPILRAAGMDVRPRGITLRQPFAWLVAAADQRLEQRHGKTSETRTWRFPGGSRWLLIHAGLKEDPRAADVERVGICPDFDGAGAATMRRCFEARGAVVAVARVAGVWPLHAELDGPLAIARDVYSFRATAEQAAALGDPTSGRLLYAWRLIDHRALDEPVPCRGAQGLWRPTDTTLAAVREQLPNPAVCGL